MLRVAWRKSFGVATLAVVAWASGCGGDAKTSGTKHERGGSGGASGSAMGGSAGSAATGGGGGRMGAGSGGTTTGGRGGAAGVAGSSGASGDAGAGGEPEGGQAGEGGVSGEGGAEGGTAGSGGMAGMAGLGGTPGGGGMGGGGGAQMGGAGAGGAGVGGALMGGAGAGGAGTGGAGGGGGSGGGIQGLDVPCQNGPGWTLFRWHYGNNGTTAIIDVWDATCSYSASSSSTCTVETVGGVSLVHMNTAILIDGTDELRARYSVQGLSFTGASVHVRARSYSTNASTRIRVASVLHGEVLMGPVDQDFTFDWYGMDWSANLLPSDQPLATAIRIYAYQGSQALAIMSVELCLR